MEVCERTGRAPTTLDLTINVMVQVRAPGQQTTADADVLLGSPEEIAAALRAFAEVSVRHLVISVSPGGVAGVERFGRVIELLDQGW